MFTEDYFGLLLLSTEDIYADKEGTLPVRPHNDKTILSLAVSDKTILCSKNVAKELPKSIKDISDGNIREYDMHIAYDTQIVNLGISTYDYNPPILYIVRSIKYPFMGVDCKIFRYRDKYKHIKTSIVEGTKIEKWRKI